MLVFNAYPAKVYSYINLCEPIKPLSATGRLYKLKTNFKDLNGRFKWMKGLYRGFIVFFKGG